MLLDHCLLYLFKLSLHLYCTFCFRVKKSWLIQVQSGPDGILVLFSWIFRLCVKSLVYDPFYHRERLNKLSRWSLIFIHRLKLFQSLLCLDHYPLRYLLLVFSKIMRLMFRCHPYLQLLLLLFMSILMEYWRTC